MAITLLTTLHSPRLRVEVTSSLHADPMQERHEFVGFDRERADATLVSMRLQRRTVKEIKLSQSARDEGIDRELVQLAEGWLGKTLILGDRTADLLPRSARPRISRGDWGAMSAAG